MNYSLVNYPRLFTSPVLFNRNPMYFHRILNPFFSLEETCIYGLVMDINYSLDFSYAKLKSWPNFVILYWYLFKLEPLHISKMRDNRGFIMIVDSFLLSSWNFIIYKSVHGIIVSYAPRELQWWPSWLPTTILKC